MRILQINAVYGVKSTGVIVKDIADALNSDRYQPYVICLESNTHSDRIFELGYNLHNNIHAILTRLFGRQGCWSVFSTKKILTLIDEINPDIIHIHNLHSNYINLPQLLQYCETKDKPLVVTLHDCWYFTGKCYHFADIGCDKWLRGCGKCPKKNLDIPSVLCDSSSSVFNIKQKGFNSVKKLHVVGCSQWITNLASRSPIFKDANFHTIYNGVDIDLFKPLKSKHKASDNFTVLVMANKWFLPVNTQLRRELLDCNNKDFHIRVVGCSQQQLALNTSDEKISYIGYLGREELEKEYNGADVFLNVTYIDTLPTVNMEALSCGIPVVTYCSGGSPELVLDGVTGYVIKQGDVKGVKHALDEIRKGKISKSDCREYAVRHFDKHVCYRQYINLYKQILC